MIIKGIVFQITVFKCSLLVNRNGNVIVLCVNLVSCGRDQFSWYLLLDAHCGHSAVLGAFCTL